MTDNGKLILGFLKKNFGKEYTKREIADAVTVTLPSVTGTMNSLIKKGYAVTTRVETVEVTPATETRKAVTKDVQYHALTEAGLAYDPEAEEAQKAAEKEAAKAAKAAAKANA